MGLKYNAACNICLKYYHIPFLSLEKIGPLPLSLLLALSCVSVTSSFQVLSLCSLNSLSNVLHHILCSLIVVYLFGLIITMFTNIFFLNSLVSISPTTFLPWSSHQLEEEKTALIVVFMFTMAPRLVK